MNREQASPDTTTRSELASWIEALASLSGEVLIVLAPSLRVLYWPQAILLDWIKTNDPVEPRWHQ